MIDMNRRLLAIGTLAGIAVLGSPSIVAYSPQDEPADAPTTAPHLESQPAAPSFLRVTEVKDKSIALQIASRSFARADGAGPRVTLVGVAHIGDRLFYRAVQNLLEDYEVVLYESVKPAGAGGAGGETDAERLESTQAAMEFVGGLIEAHRTDRNAPPADLAELERFASDKDPRLGSFLKTALVDAWGRGLIYQRVETAVPTTAPEVTSPPETQPQAGPSRGYALTSLGADGQTGGSGPDADLLLDDRAQPDPLAFASEDGLQSQLADALGLEFQLEALDYDHPNWHCSDMAMDEVSRRLAARGLDFEPIGGTLAGSSLPSKVIKLVLGMVRMADSFLEGAIADTFKVVMIELLGNQTAIEQSLDQLGEGFGEVIINDRNQVVVDDLKALMERQPQVKSVAILYGAGHMGDLSKRLTDQLGFVPAAAPGQPTDEQWFTAIKVDYTKSAVSRAEIDQLRLTVKRMMRQQMRGR